MFWVSWGCVGLHGSLYGTRWVVESIHPFFEPPLLGNWTAVSSGRELTMNGQFSENKCQPEEGNCLRCFSFLHLLPLVLLGHSGPCQGTQNQWFCWDTANKVSVSGTKLTREAPPQWSLYSLLCCWSSEAEKPEFFSFIRHDCQKFTTSWAFISVIDRLSK